MIKISLLILWTSLLIPGCNSSTDQVPVALPLSSFTCPMHPQINQQEQGSCPMCGMDLVIIDKAGMPTPLHLNENQVLLGHITTIEVGESPINSYKLLNGRLTADPSNKMIIASRFAGRITNLYINAVGITVKKGQPLYQLFSEELANLQEEYLQVMAQAKQWPADKRWQQIRNATLQRLYLFDQSDADIRQLEEAAQPMPYITYKAPMEGVLTELSVSIGQYIDSGEKVVLLEDYRTLWVEAAVYPSDFSAVKIGQIVKGVVAGWENRPLIIKVNTVSPVLQDGSQVFWVRGNVLNPQNRWQAGLQVRVYMPVGGKRTVIQLPASAVININDTKHVWIEDPAGIFEPRLVETGISDVNFVEIISGVSKGDKVVVTGGYLLYSAYLIKNGVDSIDFSLYEE